MVKPSAAEAIDEAVQIWMERAVNTEEVRAITEGHRGHEPTGGFRDAAFGLNLEGECQTCFETESVIYFKARCSCGQQVQWRLGIFSWPDTYSELAEICSDLEMFEERRGVINNGEWHPLGS